MTFHGDGIKIWAEGVYWGDFPDGGKGMSEFLGGRGGDIPPPPPRYESINTPPTTSHSQEYLLITKSYNQQPRKHLQVQSHKQKH